MTRALITCDGARPQFRWPRKGWDCRVELTSDPVSNARNVSIDNLSEALLGPISGRALDLVSIAAYVFAADQRVRRGGRRDVYGENWRREMSVAIPAGEPDFWNSGPVQDALQRCLDFATEDAWRLHFVPGEPASQQGPLGLDKAQTHTHPDRVVLFSGGTDSLCAAVMAAGDGGRPVLVSHESQTGAVARQTSLSKALREHLGTTWSFPHVGVRVRLSGSEAEERSQRSRPFLFSCLGAAVAHELGAPLVWLPDNGFVSINPPINDQLIGALATRSTHPRFIRYFNDLLRLVFAEPIRVVNPLAEMTRGEALHQALLPENAQHLIPLTVSCAATSRRPANQRHCGVCSQCVDRRFATVGAGLEEHDPAQGYGVNIFRDALPAGDGRTLALSYAQFALTIRTLSEDDLFLEYPQLFDGIEAGDSAMVVASSLVRLLKRHAENTHHVLASAIRQTAEDLARGALPAESLLRLHVGGAHDDAGSSVDQAAPEFTHSGDYRSVCLGGATYALTPAQAAAVRLLHEAWRRGMPNVDQKVLLAGTGSSRVHDVFKSSKLARAALIRTGERRGTFRLALPDPSSPPRIPT